MFDATWWWKLWIEYIHFTRLHMHLFVVDLIYLYCVQYLPITAANTFFFLSWFQLLLFYSYLFFSCMHAAMVFRRKSRVKTNTIAGTMWAIRTNTKRSRAKKSKTNKWIYWDPNPYIFIQSCIEYRISFPSKSYEHTDAITNVNPPSSYVSFIVLKSTNTLNGRSQFKTIHVNHHSLLCMMHAYTLYVYPYNINCQMAVLICLVFAMWARPFCMYLFVPLLLCARDCCYVYIIVFG